MIQVADIEENKVYDEETARRFTDPSVQTPINSFHDKKLPHDATCPPPKYFGNELLLKPLPTSKGDFLRGLIVNEEGCLVCTDQEALDK